MRILDIAIADPAGNITVFVLNGQDLGARERVDAAKRLLSDKTLRAEQVGFVSEPVCNGGLWRLTMMGGEFCGNAARSFGLFIAKKTGLRGEQSVVVEVSGAARPVTVDVDCAAGTAAAELPPPLANSFLPYMGVDLPVYHFDGITHVIAENIAPDKKTFFNIKNLFAAQHDKIPDAFGVMFYDAVKDIMRPAVYVRATETLVFESSCGSGSAAFACRRFANSVEGENIIPVRQPGGVITACVTKQGGAVKQIKIGGMVAISESRFNLDTQTIQD
ncbi:MAG: hypothetical protein LBJ35_06285 [Spirochaetaceae bacterium]|jgi:diaminopimelate epimerase|nr:hypothetical protein [Spirochaetaceae bacterium]